MTLFELCIDTPAGIAIAVDEQVDRIELCSALQLGGLTPSPALVAAAVASGVSVMVMIRPQAGGFDYDAAAIALMAAEIDWMAKAGAAGVVFGATRGGRLDLAALSVLMARAGAAGEARGTRLLTTLHRAIDLCDDPVEAIDQACGLGFDHVLTSGGAISACDGVATLAAMQRRAGGRCQIITASGIDAGSVRALIDATHVTAVHASCRAPDAGRDPPDPLGFGHIGSSVDRARVSALRLALSPDA